MRAILIYTLSIISVQVQAQVTNTDHKDSTNIYYHALDTALRIVANELKPKSIELEGDPVSSIAISSPFSGIALLRKNSSKEKQDIDVDLVLIIRNLQIDRGVFTVLIEKWRVGSRKHRYLIGSYKFVYEFVQVDKSFRLIDIVKSITVGD